MEQRIVYQNDDGGVSVIAPNYAGGYTVEDAKAAIPAGKPYKVVDVADIPADRSERMAWTVDPADLTDGVGE